MESVKNLQRKAADTKQGFGVVEYVTILTKESGLVTADYPEILFNRRDQRYYVFKIWINETTSLYISEAISHCYMNMITNFADVTTYTELHGKAIPYRRDVREPFFTTSLDVLKGLLPYYII